MAGIMVRLGQWNVALDCTPNFLPGDPAPEGYLDWHAWAAAQYRAGMRQFKCCRCGKWLFPQEQIDHVCTGLKEGQE